MAIFDNKQQLRADRDTNYTNCIFFFLALSLNKQARYRFPLADARILNRIARKKFLITGHSDIIKMDSFVSIVITTAIETTLH